MKTYWAIKHLPTGGYLPETKRGYTNSWPSTFIPPRLLPSEKAAKNVLTCWLKGKHVIDFQVNSYTGEAEIGIDVIKDKNRKLEDMEIVAVSIIEFQPSLDLKNDSNR